MIILVTKAGSPSVLNSSPLTDMVLPTASEVWFGKSLKSIPESIWIIISAGRVFQLQSPGCERHAANPHALWVQDPNGGSEVRE